jgi:glucokinase
MPTPGRRLRHLLYFRMPIAGIDLGGTKLAGAVFEENGALGQRVVMPLSGRSGAQVGALVREMVETLSRGTQLDAVGVAVPGIYRSDRGTVWAPNIPGWDDYPLLDELRSATPGRVVVESDRTCYIMGEAWQGHARAKRNAIFIAVGTGIGAGILIDGHVLRGAHDIAGAVGWLALNGEYVGEYAACGNFEFHASGPGIARAAGAADAETAFAAYARGDANAGRAIAEAVSFWGRAVANLVSIFNPEVIIFGGGVFGPAASLLDDIHAEALKWAQPISMKQVQLHVSALGPDAGLYGAAAIAAHV